MYLQRRRMRREASAVALWNTGILTMTDNPLHSLTPYRQFMAEHLNRSAVMGSTVTFWSVSPYTGIVEGEVFYP